MTTLAAVFIGIFMLLFYLCLVAAFIFSLELYAIITKAKALFKNKNKDLFNKKW